MYGYEICMQIISIAVGVTKATKETYKSSFFSVNKV